MNNTLDLAKSLISQASITPDDKGCQSIMIERLKKIGFEVHSLKFADVDNFWATRGSSAPFLLLLAILMWFQLEMKMSGILCLLSPPLKMAICMVEVQLI